MQLKLQVAPTHRFAEVSVRTKRGKVWVGKDEPTTVTVEDLLPGEEVALSRYQEEGRLTVEVVQSRKRAKEG